MRSRTARINQLYSHSFPITPEAERAIVALSSKIVGSNHASSLTVVMGKSGSGISTIIDKVIANSKKFGRRTIKLSRNGMEPALLPTEMLLQHYGFKCYLGAIRAKMETRLPPEIVQLILMARPDAIIVEDYLNGVVNPIEKREHIQTWQALTLPPTSIPVALAGPIDPFIVSRAHKDETMQIINVNEWELNDSLRYYLNTVSDSINDRFDLHLNLAQHATKIFSVCSGNTALMLERIRHCTVSTILAGNKCLDSKLIILPLKDIILSNARILNE